MQGYNISFGVAFIVLISAIQVLSGTDKTSTGAQQCCFPDQFNGKLNYSFSTAEGQNGKASSINIELKFGVDYRNDRIFGEHAMEQENGERRYFEFLADTGPAKSILIRERLAKKCWRVAMEETVSGRCELNKSNYRGDMSYDRHGLRVTGKLFARKNIQDEGMDHLKRYGSLLLVTGDTCLPVAEMSDRDPTRLLSSFRDMESGLGHFGNMKAEEMCEEILDGNDDGSADTESLTASRRMGMYTYLRRLFYPPGPPTPCCGPQQWEASGIKYITYTTGDQGQTMTSVTSLPRIAVDHAAGKVAAQVIINVAGQLYSNVSYLLEYGESSIMMYKVDWLADGGACSIYEVLDSERDMKSSSCLPSSAQYDKTIRLGGGELNSIRLNVWNVLSSNETYQYNAQLCVTPIECVTVMAAYTWESETEKVRGTLVLSDVKTHIVNQKAAFSIPSVCDGIVPLTASSAEISDDMEQLRAFYT